MIRYGLSYGLRSTRRRLRALLLPIVTTATGAFLVVEVAGLTDTVRAQARTIGDAGELSRATVLIAVVVLLVGVAEVAVSTTRTIVARTREMGVLGAAGVPRRSVTAALLVEPTVAAVIGASVGGVLALVVQPALAAVGVGSAPRLGTALAGALASLVLSGLTALLASVLPAWRAASRPPVHALSQGT